MFCDGSNIGGDVQALTYREELGDFNNRREFELSWLTLCLDHPLISIAKWGGHRFLCRLRMQLSSAFCPAALPRLGVFLMQKKTP